MDDFIPPSENQIGVARPNTTVAPGALGDWTKVMRLIVTDGRDKNGCYRRFLTLDGTLIGEVREVLTSNS